MHGDGTRDPEDPATNRSTAALVFLLAGVLLNAAIPTTASTGNQQSCEVHEPIRILEDKGDDGFVWDDPITGEEVYRPGSGVVAGDGSASSPYVIEGWCISGADWDPPAIDVSSCEFGADGPDPESTGVVVCGTTAHFVLRNTTVNLWGHGTGLGNVSPETGAVEHTDHLNNTYQLHLDKAAGVSIRDNLVHGLDATEEIWSQQAISGTSDNVTVEHNRIVVAERLVTLDGEGVRIADNELDSGSKAHVDSVGDELAVANNTAVSDFFATLTNRAIKVHGANVLVEGNNVDGHRWAGIHATGPGVEIANNTLTTTDPSTGVWVSGADVRVHNTTIEDGGLGVYAGADTDGGIVENVTVAGASTGFKAYDGNDTTWRYNEASGYTDQGMHVDGAENVTVRWTNFEDTNGTALMVENTDTTVDARHNWWGCPDGPDDPACDDVLGDAVYEPWVTAPERDAGNG